MAYGEGLFFRNVVRFENDLFEPLLSMSDSLSWSQSSVNEKKQVKRASRLMKLVDLVETIRKHQRRMGTERRSEDW